MRVAVGLIGALLLAASAMTAGAQPMRCADVSALDDVEAAGAVFVDGDPLLALRDRGLDTVRLRLWHTPEGGRDGLDAMLALAARADALGLDLLLDLHYSDTWADPGHQEPPLAWTGLDAATLADSVRQYTRRVVEAFDRQGTPPAVVQIGNEITGGMLWPTGRVGGAFDTPGQWRQLASLVRAGAEAVREVLG
ncbi:MAG: glycosyl hydrolase 53 family protein, partial [Bacteroidota bacterium]